MAAQPDQAGALHIPVEHRAIEAVLAEQQALEMLRFITCGSVDDGKSTLIGRLLWDSRNLFEDHVRSLEADSRQYGTQGTDIDLALLVDGLLAEREQGITIDVAYRYFATARRRFIVADTPGHEQYTRNMVTGASTADLALLLVDASKGLTTQTRRHAYLVSLLGIHRVVLAVNKMDAIAFDAERFAAITGEFTDFSRELGFTSLCAIPMSALRGDNVTIRSGQTPWYQGPTLLEHLESVDLGEKTSERLVFPVQWVNRPNPNFRGFAGTIAEGALRPGDEIRVTRSGQLASVREIVTMDGNLAQAHAGQAVTVTLDREVDVSRGDVLALAAQPLESSDHFEAHIIWMGEESGLVGRTYELKIGTLSTPASITTIKYRVNVNNLLHEPATRLDLNEICVCNVSTHSAIPFDAFSRSRTLGGFIIVDRESKATLAAGLVRHNLRRSENVHRQALSIARAAREKLNGHRGKVIWMTGLPASGKSTLANALEVRLHELGYRTYILDGDNVRLGLCKDLGFTDSDRLENVRRVTEVCRLMLDAGLVVIVSLISPFRRERAAARERVGPADFIEVFVDTPLEVCEARDPKGLFKKARAGQLPNLSGVGSAYEPPDAADVVIDGATESVQSAAQRVLDRLVEP
jgi:bifunctional enzyme CysN/CysC